VKSCCDFLVKSRNYDKLVTEHKRILWQIVIFFGIVRFFLFRPLVFYHVQVWSDSLVTSSSCHKNPLISNCKYLYSCMTTEVSTASSVLEVLDHRHHLWNISLMLTVMVYLCLCLFSAAAVIMSWSISLSVGFFVNFSFKLKPDFRQKSWKNFSAKLQHSGISVPTFWKIRDCRVILFWLECQAVVRDFDVCLCMLLLLPIIYLNSGGWRSTKSKECLHLAQNMHINIDNIINGGGENTRTYLAY